MVMYSRQGSSGASAVGLRSNADPVAAGAHRFFWSAPNAVLPAAPCTISIATRRSFFGAANARAGAIASRNGSAIVAPSPFRTVRRSRCFCVMKFISLYGPPKATLPSLPLTDRVTRPIVNSGLVATPCTNADIFRFFFSASRMTRRTAHMSGPSMRRPSA